MGVEQMGVEPTRRQLEHVLAHSPANNAIYIRILLASISKGSAKLHLPTLRHNDSSCTTHPHRKGAFPIPHRLH